MCPCRGGLRFVFYGRVSTEDHQDQVTSLARQQHKAATFFQQGASADKGMTPRDINTAAATPRRARLWPRSSGSGR